MSKKKRAKAKCPENSARNRAKRVAVDRMLTDAAGIMDEWDEKHGPTVEELEAFASRFPRHPVSIDYKTWLGAIKQAGL